MSYDDAWYAVVEGEHEIQNPVSQESIRLLGQHLQLGRQSRVLDVACGTCGPALILAEEYGSSFVCVDNTPAFVRIAWARIVRAGLERWIDLREGDAAHVELDGYFDAAICLGASFVFGGFVPALERLFMAAPLVAVGEPYLRLHETVALAAHAGDVAAVLTSTEEDWDVYESKRARTLERSMSKWSPEHDDLKERQRARERRAQERRRREHRGWAIIVCRRA